MSFGSCWVVECASTVLDDPCTQDNFGEQIAFACFFFTAVIHDTDNDLVLNFGFRHDNDTAFIGEQLFNLR